MRLLREIVPFSIADLPPTQNIPTHVADVVGAREREADLELLADDVEGCGYAGLPLGRKGVEEGFAYEAAAGTQRQGFEHVLAGLDATVEQNFAAIACGLDDFGEDLNRRRGAIDLAPAMV